MAIDFPSSPIVGQQYTFNGLTYVYTLRGTWTVVLGSYQPLDTELTAFAGLIGAADQAPYFTGYGTAVLMTVTAAARTVLDDTSVGAMLTTMGGLSSATAATTYAPLASPTFTGDPKAPTPTAGDSDTSIATTAFVAAAVAAGGGGGTSTTISDTPPGSPANGSLWWESDTGTLFISYNDGTSTQWVAVGGGGSSVAIAGPPQGRLTLQSLTPVMTTTQAAKTTLYYTPYQGNSLPIDGTMMAFSELSALTTDATKSPAAIGASKCNDWFVWNDAGTLRLGHGPDWTNDTTRSVGTALVMVNGILLNNVAITNGPAAQRGTYVGTTYSNASSQLDWIYGGSAVGGVRGVHNVWNMYNRRKVSSLVNDQTVSESYGTATWKMFLGGANNAVDFVSGLAEDTWSASCTCYAASSNASGAITIGLDSTTAPAGGSWGTVGIGGMGTGWYSAVSLGKHTVNFIEIGAAGSLFYGNSSATNYMRDGLMFEFWM